ncbi:MAG: TIR domain-containing protein [Clostridia bacterium]|nr:TIR domain-containing protein [Clostridia bacterium]
MSDKDTSKSIFLSHSSKDKFFVRTLADHLRSYGIKVWIDEAEINIGDSLTEKIGRAIEDTDYVGVVLSHNSINSEWVQRELQIALQKEIKGKKVVVLPILIETVKIPPFLKDKLYADFTTPEKFKIEFQKLLRALRVSVERKKKKIDITPAEILKKPSEHLTLVKRKLTTFEDIKILEIDDSKSYKPDPKKLLYNIYMKLSASAPLEWQQIFEAERRFPRHPMWRNAWLEGDHIVIHCVPDEIEKYHAKDLMEDVDNSNSKYRKYLMEEAQKEAKKVEQEISERDKLKELKQRIRFS